MKTDTILVLANPGEPQLAILRHGLADSKIIIGNTIDVFAKDAAQATVLFNWSGSLALFKQVFAMCHNVRWVHSLSVGLERSLSPELAESPVPLTNGAGVFSASLGEFSIGAILYFAKDFRRMIRNQHAGVWEAFDVLPIGGQPVGIIGYGDIGRAVGARARALGMNVLAVKRHIPRSDSADPIVARMYAPEQRLEMLPHCDYVVVAAPLTP